MGYSKSTTRSGTTTNPESRTFHSSTTENLESSAHSRAVEYLILVMGQTGVGKSSFINSAVDQTVMPVGHDMASETKEVKHVSCFHPFDSSKPRVILVDTPGFNDADLEDSQVMTRIIEQMTRWHGTRFGGIIYLSQGAKQELSLLNKLGNTMTSDAILHVKTKISQSRELEVCFTNDRRSAWSIIDKVMEQPCNNDISLILLQLAAVAGALPKAESKEKKKRKKREKQGILNRIKSMFWK